MEINKQLFEDILSGKLKGTFVLRNGNTYSSVDLYRNYNKFRFTHPYMIGFGSYTPKGLFPIYGGSKLDIADFIPNTDMKENELTIEIPEGKIVDWESSQKQNKIVFKDEQLNYRDICIKLSDRNSGHFYIDGFGDIEHSYTNPGLINTAPSEHQLECILAKNQLATVAKYLNDGWKPAKGSDMYNINNYYGNLVVYLFKEECSMCLGQVIFKTKELALQAIEILGEETVKLALEPLGI